MRYGGSGTAEANSKSVLLASVVHCHHGEIAASEDYLLIIATFAFSYHLTVHPAFSPGARPG